jgi:hypothetical protein
MQNKTNKSIEITNIDKKESYNMKTKRKDGKDKD